MDASKLNTDLSALHLTKLELESIVDGVGSESTHLLGFLADYPLVGGGEVGNALCQHFKGWRICLNVAAHEAAGKSGVFTRKVHFSCGSPTCPLCCRPSWAVAEARKMEARLKVASDRVGLPAEHIVISFSPKYPKYYGEKDEKVLRRYAMKACEDLGISSGGLIFHGSRHRRFERINGSGFRQFGTDWSPHYHELGFVKGGYTCRGCPRKSNCEEGCGGFDDRRWQYSKKTGIYVKVMYEKRRTVMWTAWYQLHHASFKKDAVRAHVVTWIGESSYRNMGKVKVVKSGGECPICKDPLQNGIYTGKKFFELNRYSPNYVRDSMQAFSEDGLQVWYYKARRSRNSYLEKSAVKNGFTVHFEGGSHG